MNWYYALLSKTPFDGPAQDSLSLISFHHLIAPGCQSMSCIAQIRDVPRHVGPRWVGKDLTANIGESCTVWEVEDVHEGEFLDADRLPSMAVIERRIAYIATHVLLLRENDFIHVQLLPQVADVAVEHYNVGSQSPVPGDI